MAATVEPIARLIEELARLPGIGPKRKRELLKRFGSLQALRAASVEELATVPGMTRSAAAALKDALS